MGKTYRRDVDSWGPLDSYENNRFRKVKKNKQEQKNDNRTRDDWRKNNWDTQSNGRRMESRRGRF